MRIMEAKDRNAQMVEQLVSVWEGSVKATHLFLSEAERNAIKQYVPEALTEVPVLVLAENDDGNPLGFMGIGGNKLEMLFVADESRGKGIGKKLLQYGLEHYAVNEVAVNEQNPSARGFYEHSGFEVYKRTERDEQGNPYPLLYMKRNA